MSHNFPLFLPNVTKTFANFHNAHNDENSRLNESREALFELMNKNLFKQIVIVDGSNNPVLSSAEIEFFNEKGVVIEQLLFTQNKELVEKFGKGHGEMQITNYMVENSKLVNQAGGFVKLTPRYFFDNIEKIMPILNQEKIVFFFYYPFLIRNIKKYTLSIFYKTTLDFYKTNISESIDYHSKDTYGLMESILFKQIIGLNKKSIKVSFPFFSGISGTTGKKIRNQYYFFRNTCSKFGLMAYAFK